MTGHRGISKNHPMGEAKKLHKSSKIRYNRGKSKKVGQIMTAFEVEYSSERILPNSGMALVGAILERGDSGRR